MSVRTNNFVDLSGRSSMFRTLLYNLSGGWTGMPADWSDIRKDCPANSIALYAAHSADYSSYDNLGFTATCTGGYKVYIDGVQYGSTYASGSQCSITWSTSGITTGDSITIPSALKAHKIWIEPATNGENITAFHCARVAASGQEAQGILWEHFNLTNTVIINNMNATGSIGSTNYYNPALIACTAKKNTLNFAPDSYNCKAVFLKCENLEYLPKLNCTYTENIDASSFFANCQKIKKIDLVGLRAIGAGYMFYNCRNLEKLPELNLPSTMTMNYFITNDTKLKNTTLTIPSASLRTVGAFGSASYFMSGFKGLRVSSSAPFSDGTSPQINVSYTGMDRTALVQLFNDLPSVSDGQIINVTGATGSEDLTAEDVLIATNKGWTIIGGPTPVQLYAYTDGNNNTIYAKDENLVGTFKSLNTNDFSNRNITIDSDGIAHIVADSSTPAYYYDNQTIYKIFNAAQSYTTYDFVYKVKVNQGTDYGVGFCYSTTFATWSWGHPTYMPTIKYEDYVGACWFATRHMTDSGNTRGIMIPTAINVEQYNKLEIVYDSTTNGYTYFKINDVVVGQNDSYYGRWELPSDEWQHRIGPRVNENNTLNASYDIDLKESYLIISGRKYTYAILNTTSQLYNSAFQKIMATAENYNNVIKIGDVVYTRDTTKDTTAVVPD